MALGHALARCAIRSCVPGYGSLHLGLPYEEYQDPQLQFLRELVVEHVWIDGDPFQIDEHSWAIHGVIPYGGGVPMAVFNTYEDARKALDDAFG
jgi:hypothetical protein